MTRTIVLREYDLKRQEGDGYFFDPFPPFGYFTSDLEGTAGHYLKFEAVAEKYQDPRVTFRPSPDAHYDLDIRRMLEIFALYPKMGNVIMMTNDREVYIWQRK